MDDKQPTLIPSGVYRSFAQHYVGLRFTYLPLADVFLVTSLKELGFLVIDPDTSLIGVPQP